MRGTRHDGPNGLHRHCHDNPCELCGFGERARTLQLIWQEWHMLCNCCKTAIGSGPRDQVDLLANPHSDPPGVLRKP